MASKGCRVLPDCERPPSPPTEACTGEEGRENESETGRYCVGGLCRVALTVRVLAHAV